MPVKAMDCLDGISKAAAEMETQNVPIPGDDVIRELALIFRLRPAPLHQPRDAHALGVGGQLDAAARHGDVR